MPFKIHFLHSHLDFFPENLSMMNRANASNRKFPTWNSATGRRDPEMTGAYYWFLYRQILNMVYKKKSTGTYFF
jgi:hypothetical protein